MKHKLLQTWARKSAKLLAAVALLATTAGVAMAADLTYTSPAITKNDKLSMTSPFDLKWGDVTWTIINVSHGTAIHAQRNGTTSFQFGAASNDKQFKNVTFSASTPFAGKTIKSASVKAYTKATGATVSLKIGDAVVGEAQNIATSSTEYTWNDINAVCPENGKFSISFDAPTTTPTTLNVVAISVTYGDAVNPNQPAAPTFTPDGGEVDANSTVTIAGDEKTQSLKYWFGDDETAATTVNGSSATVTITEACTLNAIAIGEGDVESGVKTASYTLTPAINTYKQITTELTSGKYVFMCGENFVNPVLVNNRCNFTDDFTKTDDEIVASEKYEFTITVDGEFATIQGVDGKYLGINAAGNNYFTPGTDASTENFKWKFTVDNGVVTFASAISDTNVLAQHMGASSLYSNFAPGVVEGSVYPTLYKLYVAPVAPELPAPTVEDGVEVNVVDGGWRIRPEQYPVTLTFAVEDGVQMYAKQVTAAQTAAEDDNDGYTALADNKLTLTKSGEEYSVYAMKDGVKSEAKTITADVPSGIAGIEAENGEAVYFNLQGVRVENPENGIFIRVQNGKAVKITK